MRTAIGIPRELARLPRPVFHPRDLAEIYAHPRAEVARLVRTGALCRLKPGYYTLVPRHRLGDPTWTPDLHAAALGISQADYGVDQVALMAASAARIHGAIPRELAVAVLAVPKQRPPIRINDAQVVFVVRDVPALDLERTDTELGSGWVTTIEQTLLDLAARTTLGGLTTADSHEAIRALAVRADWAIVENLATEQHKPAALRIARSLI